jgi:hypothetical protein
MEPIPLRSLRFESLCRPASQQACLKVLENGRIVNPRLQRMWDSGVGRTRRPHLPMCPVVWVRLLMRHQALLSSSNLRLVAQRSDGAPTKRDANIPQSFWDSNVSRAFGPRIDSLLAVLAKLQTYDGDAEVGITGIRLRRGWCRRMCQSTRCESFLGIVT